MPNTQRSISALYDVLPDNTAGDISPQDVRDIVETLRPDCGQIYISASAETGIAVQSTFQKAAGTTTLTVDPVARGWSMPDNNRLLYGGTADRLAFVTIGFSMQIAGSGDDILFRLAKNGTTIADTEIIRRVGASAVDGAAAMVSLIAVTNGDYLEMWVANDSATDNLTVSRMIMSVVAYAQ